jgi:hypothetical protein
MIETEVLCSLTTIKIKDSSWEDKLHELSELRLSRFALFVTGLNSSERIRLYEKLKILRNQFFFEIPFVHATSDMTNIEFHKLRDEFGTDKFNLHPTRCYPIKDNLDSTIKEKIYIENATPDGLLLNTDIEGFAGLCLDLSHCEDAKYYKKDVFQSLENLTYHYQVGANHISSVLPSAHAIYEGRPIRSNHIYSGLSSFDYVLNYHPNFWGAYAAIELDDSFATQLEVKTYIESMLKKMNSESEIENMNNQVAA